ncbi:hypothetical protein [Actinokineospora iranica]|uniref:hypothetical protein n=1 Tax=Actinokineospora iranica TaxID=1271860 RepID=UPI001E53EDA0|nr:hypothetical protein [Actinokineospora iranica]
MGEHGGQSGAHGAGAMLARFEDKVDPERKLDPQERERRAASVRRAYFRALAMRSARVRARGSVR